MEEEEMMREDASVMVTYSRVGAFPWKKKKKKSCHEFSVSIFCKKEDFKNLVLHMMHAADKRN